MYNACRSGAKGATASEYKTFENLDDAVAWVNERESGDVEEWVTGVQIYQNFPRAQWV